MSLAIELVVASHGDQPARVGTLVAQAALMCAKTVPAVMDCAASVLAGLPSQYSCSALQV